MSLFFHTPVGRLECRTNLDEPVEPVGALKQESGKEEIEDVMPPARHSGSGDPGTRYNRNVYSLIFVIVMLWCFTACMQEVSNR